MPSPAWFVVAAFSFPALPSPIPAHPACPEPAGTEPVEVSEGFVPEEHAQPLPIQQPSFPFQRPDSSHILADLKTSLVDIILVPDGEVPDVDELASQLYPEIC